MASNSYSRKLPSIPTPRGKEITPALARILTPMKTIIENLIVERDNNDLQALDIEEVIAQVQENIDTGVLDTGTGNDPVPRATGLVAAGDVKNITLTWEAPSYSNHAYTEVFRSTTNDRPTGSRIGTTAGATFVDKTANKNQQPYYYWIRFYSSGGIYGPFNADNNAGVEGNLAEIGADEFGDGIAPVEYLSALPSTGLFNGRVVYNSTDDTLNVYEGSAWTTYYPDYPTEVLSSLPVTGLYSGRTVYNSTDSTYNIYNGSGWTSYYESDHPTLPIVPNHGSDLDNAVTISTAAWNTVATVTLDMGAAADYTSIHVMVTGQLDANATPGTATTLDVRFTYDGTAAFTENGIAVPANGSPVLYSRNYAISVPGADTGNKVIEFQAWMAGTATDFTDLHMTVVAYA